MSGRLRPELGILKGDSESLGFKFLFLFFSFLLSFSEGSFLAFSVFFLSSEVLLLLDSFFFEAVNFDGVDVLGEEAVVDTGDDAAEDVAADDDPKLRSRDVD